jgi:hypothetical protein
LVLFPSSNKNEDFLPLRDWTLKRERGTYAIRKFRQTR